MHDDWLDKFELKWQSEKSPPSLLDFLKTIPHDEGNRITVRELALIDLEHRWRKRCFSLLADSRERSSVVGTLATWRDYCQLLPQCDPGCIESISHEFRVRQSFGDQPNARQLVDAYPEAKEELDRRLPIIAAELTHASITYSFAGNLQHCGPCPGRLEIGRQRVGEPFSPYLFERKGKWRLLIASLPDTHISRKQCTLEVIAKNRVKVQHTSANGSVRCSSGTILKDDDACELEIPCTLDFYGRLVRFDTRSTGAFLHIPL